jgi:hypothetical protein
MVQPKKQSMMETTTMMPENKSASTTRVGCDLPSRVPITIPQTSPPIPPPMSPTAGERLPFEVCLVNNADSAVKMGGAIKAIQNHSQLILNDGGSVTAAGFVDGKSWLQYGQMPVARFSGNNCLQKGQFIGE